MVAIAALYAFLQANLTGCAPCALHSAAPQQTRGALRISSTLLYKRTMAHHGTGLTGWVDMVPLSHAAVSGQVRVRVTQFALSHTLLASCSAGRWTWDFRSHPRSCRARRTSRRTPPWRWTSPQALLLQLNSLQVVHNYFDLPHHCWTQHNPSTSHTAMLGVVHGSACCGVGPCCLQGPDYYVVLLIPEVVSSASQR